SQPGRWRMVAKSLTQPLFLLVPLTLIVFSSQAADDKQAAKPPSPDANVNIGPRIKPVPGKPDPDRALAESRPASIRIDKTLVQINVTVTDPLNRFVTGLDKDYFKLFEDKSEQQIAQFSSEDAPLSIGLVFDTSGSMGS